VSLQFYSVLLIGLFYIGEIHSQDPSHKRYGLRDGLPSEEVYDVQQDQDGLIWISTDRGVASFDGYEFTTYDVSDGLAHNTIFEIYMDNKGRLWFSGYNGSLTYYEKGKFTILKKLTKTFQKRFNGNWITDMHDLDDNKLILSISFRTLRSVTNNYILDIETEELTKLNIDLQKDPSAKVQIYNKYNLLKHNATGITLTDKYVFDSTNYMYCIDKTQKAAISGYEYSVSEYSQSPSSVEIIRQGKNIFSQEIESQTEKIIVIDKHLYVCTWDGLLIYDTESLTTSPRCILKGKLITSIINDREKNIWVSTQNDGIYCFTNNLQIKTYPKQASNPSKLSLFKDHLFIGYRNGELLQALDKNLKTVFTFKDRDRIYYPSLTLANDCAYITDLSRIVYDKGFKIKERDYNIQYNPISRVNLILNDGAALRSLTDLRISYKNKSGIIVPAKLGQTYSGYQCLNSKILLGKTSGLFIVSDYSDEIDVHQEEEIDIRINSIVPYNDSILVLSSIGEGLIFYNCNSESVIGVIEKELLSPQVNMSYVDSRNNIWVGTNFGLNELKINITGNQLELDSINSYTYSDGLYSNFILDIKEWREEIWVICEGGINYFKPSELSTPNVAPLLTLDSVVVLDKRININATSTLKHDENDIHIYYKGITYNKPISNEVYRYKLRKDNKEAAFKYTNNRNLLFTNLNAGQYDFELSARNSNDVWSHQPIRFSFEIKEKFTQTLLFKTLSLLGIILLALAINRYREQLIINRSRQQRELQAAELKTKIAELDALRNQMNPHFIYNALNSIQNFIFNDSPEKANYLLSRFSRLMRKSLDLSKLENITIEEEVDYLSNYLELEKMRFGDKLNYNIEVDNNLLLNNKIPPLLIQPIVENAIKHGIASRKKDGLINIAFEKDNNGTLITVTDNGIGYNPNTKRKKSTGPNALEIINDRIDLLNSVSKNEAWFKIEQGDPSNDMRGTSAIIRLPNN